MSTWRSDLLHAARKAICWDGALDVVTNEAHGRTLTAFLHAFGHDPECSIFAEARTPDRSLHQNARPADVLIIHPRVGVLFVEVKGWTLETITHVNAGTVHRWVNGQDEAKDPWMQAANACSQLQAAVRKVHVQRGLSSTLEPYFDCMVAFANVSKTAWETRGFAGTHHPEEILFGEDLSSPEKLRAKLLARMKIKAGRRLPSSPDALGCVREALGSSEIFKKHNRHAPISPSTLGALIDAAELGGKRFSPEQRDLAEREFDGRSQIIRGVAGSGKSAVLVKNLANMLDRKLHGTQQRLGEENPVERVLVVCFNQTLVPLLRQMLEAACRELMHTSLPVFVDVFHVASLEYDMCRRSGGLLKYLSYTTWPGEEKGREIAANYCRQIDAFADDQRASFNKLQYSTIYVDEGQDLFSEEYELLMRLLRGDKETDRKNIVVFYDDAQNLYGRPRPTWSDLGIQVIGRASVMKTCYRNPKQIMEFAFNLLLGAAAEMRVSTREFADAKFLKDNGLVEELPDRWLVHFAARADGEVPPVKLFATRLKEVKWLAAHLKWLIEEQGVQAEEILLVAQRPSEFEWYLEQEIRHYFPQMARLNKPYGKNRTEKERLIFQNGTLTLTSVQSAKGYDCPVVVLIGVDLFGLDVESRAAFYVAATRAKMRLFVSGLHKTNSLAAEAEALSALLRTQPVAVREEVEVVFKPAFRKGECVRDRRSRTGIVVVDSQRKPLPSQKGEYQTVRVDFGGVIEEVVWPLAQLDRL